MTKQSKSYNGYKNYAQWNQSLWLNNDEGLYGIMRDHIRWSSNMADAVEQLFDLLSRSGEGKTPDGVKWSKAGIRAGMIDL